MVWKAPLKMSGMRHIELVKTHTVTHAFDNRQDIPIDKGSVNVPVYPRSRENNPAYTMQSSTLRYL